MTIPSLKGLRKDHKGDLDGNPTKGPKFRPLAAASKAPNSALGNLVARVAKALGNDISERIGGKIISTEELKRDIDDVNKKLAKTWKGESERAKAIRESRRTNKLPTIQDRDNMFVFRMDVTALYPSIKKDMAMKTIMKAVYQSKTKFNMLYPLEAGIKKGLKSILDGF